MINPIEFIISAHIKAHPLALVHFDQLADPAAGSSIPPRKTHALQHSRRPVLVVWPPAE